MGGRAVLAPLQGAMEREGAQSGGWHHRLISFAPPGRGEESAQSGVEVPHSRGVLGGKIYLGKEGIVGGSSLPAWPGKMGTFLWGAARGLVEFEGPEAGGAGDVEDFAFGAEGGVGAAEVADS